MAPSDPVCDSAGDMEVECLNCGGAIDPSAKPGSLFCSEICRARADTVRYGRRIFRDGRIADPLVEEAFKAKMAFAVTEGGYPRGLRQLDAAIRAAVIERDAGKCVLCGQPGTEIDHIRDSSPDLANLQLLCHDCHMRKTEQNYRPIQAGSRAEDVWSELMTRIRAPEPLLVCDDEINWASMWRQLAKDRRALLPKIGQPS